MKKNETTILLAENEGSVRKMLAQILRNKGYNVLAAANGEQALTLAKRHSRPIDLLITDIVMPGMGGADIYAWLKSEQPDIKVLFISGFMSREPLEGSFLKKPFSADTLLDKVEELVLSPPPGKD